jgi:hypothetical protein
MHVLPYSRQWLFILASTSITLFHVLPVNASEPIIIDQTKQLFLDDEIIETKNKIQRIIHPVTKHPANPILEADSPWEDKRCLLYGSVIKENKSFRMWYYTSIKERPKENRKSTTGVAYAESQDGIHWNKPELGLLKINGMKTNLLLERDRPQQPGHPFPYFYELFGVQKSPKTNQYMMGFLSIQHPYSGPSEDPFHKRARRGLGLATSPDGINWKIKNSFVTDSICDGDTHFMYDPKGDRFVLYGRTKVRSEKLLKAWEGKNYSDWAQKNYWGRVVARVESPDMIHWNHTKPKKAPVVMSADEKDEAGTEIYSMMVFPYESVYIGLIQIFHNQPDQSHLDFQLAVSRDTIHFERVGDRTTFLPCGGIGEWDRFNNSIATNPPIRVGNELRFYYGGRSYRHGPYNGDDNGVIEGGIGLATIPIDRFVSLSGSYNNANFVTKPLLIKNKNFYLNANSKFGKIKVEILNLDNQVIAKSVVLQSDELKQQIEWEEGNIPGGNQPVRLRFSLENAHLYSFWTE